MLLRPPVVIVNRNILDVVEEVAISSGRRSRLYMKPVYGVANFSVDLGRNNNKASPVEKDTRRVRSSPTTRDRSSRRAMPLMTPKVPFIAPHVHVAGVADASIDDRHRKLLKIRAAYELRRSKRRESESKKEHAPSATRSGPATMLEASRILRLEPGDRIRIKPIGQPYSIPDPEKWAGIAKYKQQKPIYMLRPEVSPTATWYADQATRPVLLTFDAFGTLFEPKEKISTQYCEIAGEFGLEIQEADVEDSFGKAYEKISLEYPNYGISTGMSPDHWWSQVIRHTIEPLIDKNIEVPSTLISSLYDRFASDEGYRLFPDVDEILSLIGTGYQAGLWPPRRTMLGVISNSDPRVRSILASFGLHISPSLYPPRYSPHSRHHSHDFGPAHFAFATLSYEVGHAKPSSEIYSHAAIDAQLALDALHQVARLTRTANALLSQVRSDFYHIHVGDDLEKDVLPAMDCGWDAVLLDRWNPEAVSTRVLQDGRVVTTINSLASLRQVVTKERIEATGIQEIRLPVGRPRDVLRSRPWPFRYGGRFGRRLIPHPVFPPEMNVKMYV